MIERRNVFLKGRNQKITDTGHQRLKAAKPATDRQYAFHGHFLHRKTFAHSNRKCIHRQADSEQYQFPQRQRLHPSILFHYLQYCTTYFKFSQGEAVKFLTFSPFSATIFMKGRIIMKENSKKNTKTKEKRIVWTDLKAEIREHKATFAVYVVLRVIVITAMVLSLLRGDYENLFVCTLSLILFLVPAFAEKNLGLHLPSALEIIILLFIFAAEILGEMSSFYIKVPFWDTMLHTMNGFLCAAIGFALVDMLNRDEKFTFLLSPLYLAVVAFCFSMTVGVLWEFFEFAGDYLFALDMQKDTIVNSVSSVNLDPSHTTTVIHIKDISDVIIVHSDGTQESLGLGGYLDIGIYDTMKDLIVNLVGAVIFSIIGYFHVKKKGTGKIATRFIPQIDANTEHSNTET